MERLLLRFAFLDHRLEGLNDLGGDWRFTAICRRGGRHAGREGSWVGHVRLLSELLLHRRSSAIASIQLEMEDSVKRVLESGSQDNIHRPCAT